MHCMHAIRPENTCVLLQCTYREAKSVWFHLYLAHLGMDFNAVILHWFRDFTRIWILQQYNHTCISSISILRLILLTYLIIRISE